MSQLTKKILSRYENKSFVVQLKSRFLLYMNFILIIFIPVMLVYTAYLHLNNPIYNYTIHYPVLYPTMAALIIVIMITILLVKGYFSLAANTLFICLSIAIWTVIFLDRSHPISRLDTISVILALFTMVPIVISRRKYLVFVYTALNLAALYACVYIFHDDFDLPYHVYFDYLADNTISFIFIAIVSYNVLSINRQALDRVETDIRERTKAEDALIASEQHYRSIFDRSPIGIFHYDRKLIITDCNEKFVSILQSTRQKLIGLNMNLLNDLRVLPCIAEAVEGRESIYEGPYQATTSSANILISLRTSPYSDAKGKILGGIGMVEDVTGRLRAIEALRESERKFRSFIEQSSESLTLSDEYGTVIEWNHASERTTGLTREEVLGKKIWEMQFRITPKEGRSPERDEYFVTSIRNAIATGQAPFFYNPFEVQIVKPDGEKKIILQTMFPIRTEKGYRIGSIASDITSRKEAEENLKESLKEKSALLRELYHRTKNNMQVISAMLSLQASYSDNEYIARVFKEMENRIHAMALVHEMLYQSQNLSSINLKDYIVKLTHRLAQSYVILPERISFALDMEEVYILIDIAIPCGIILNELISNSIKHAFPGDRKGTIKIKLSKKAGGEIELLFSDDGVGVPAGFNFRSQKSLGLQSIFNIGENQLRGKVQFNSNDGTQCTIQFTDTYYSKRI